MIQPTFTSKLKHAYGFYYLVPLTCALVWLGGLLALIGLWARDGTPKYGQLDSAPILFVSNVGAEYQKVFIGFCVPTAALYLLSLFLERWLRHVDRIPAHGDHNKRIVIYDIVAIVCATIGAIALILLSSFNDLDFPTVHWLMAVVFIVFVAISAAFQSAEIRNLKKDHPDRQHLLRNAVVKLFLVILAICVAIAFAVCYGICGGDVDYSATPYEVSRCKRISSTAAVLEWSIALVLDAYFFTLVLDLWPASKTSPRFLRRLERQEQNVLDKLGVNNPSSGRESLSMTSTGQPVIPTGVETAGWNHAYGTNQPDPNHLVSPPATRNVHPGEETIPVTQHYAPATVVQPVQPLHATRQRSYTSRTIDGAYVEPREMV